MHRLWPYHVVTPREGARVCMRVCGRASKREWVCVSEKASDSGCESGCKSVRVCQREREYVCVCVTLNALTVAVPFCGSLQVSDARDDFDESEGMKTRYDQLLVPVCPTPAFFLDSHFDVVRGGVDELVAVLPH